eukprot:TRINITY_DN13370_c0_g1_i1.p1 TRINITY_DN13370_c0_g1~~TRINITY_DN13370_c0_g1_i1.p1  ORF type:complete len:135 (+),score=36.05 TRINITY_DN13370_c0_g1_i1:69-473(+)
MAMEVDRLQQAEVADKQLQLETLQRQIEEQQKLLLQQQQQLKGHMQMPPDGVSAKESTPDEDASPSDWQDSLRSAHAAYHAGSPGVKKYAKKAAQKTIQKHLPSVSEETLAMVWEGFQMSWWAVKLVAKHCSKK